MLFIRRRRVGYLIGIQSITITLAACALVTILCSREGIAGTCNFLADTEQRVILTNESKLIPLSCMFSRQ